MDGDVAAACAMQKVCLVRVLQSQSVINVFVWQLGWLQAPVAEAVHAAARGQ